MLDAWRCPKCRSVAAATWLLFAGALVWIVCLALYVPMRALFAEVVAVHSSLGVVAPLPARIFSVLSDTGGRVLGAAMLGLPLLMLGVAWNRPARLGRWSRGYVSSGLVGIVWAACGAFLLYLTFSTTISRLR
jgi:hypothetical protein